MYDALLALAFATMVLSPCVVAFHAARHAESHLD